MVARRGFLRLLGIAGAAAVAAPKVEAAIPEVKEEPKPELLLKFLDPKGELVKNETTAVIIDNLGKIHEYKTKDGKIPVWDKLAQPVTIRAISLQYLYVALPPTSYNSGHEVSIPLIFDRQYIAP